MTGTVNSMAIASLGRQNVVIGQVPGKKIILWVSILTDKTQSGTCVMDSQSIGKQSGSGLYTPAFQIFKKKWTKGPLNFLC